MGKIIIGIQQDNQYLTSGRRQSFSKRWHELAKKTRIETRDLDIHSSSEDFFEHLSHCTAFMWWFAQPLSVSHPGRKLIMSLGHTTKIPSFPNTNTIWHFDDKIAQYYLLRTAKIPTPDTWVIWSYDEAKKFLVSSQYPLVLKLTSGIISRNVALVQNNREAMQAANVLFRSGIFRLPPDIPCKWLFKKTRDALRIFRAEETEEEFHKGYLLLQEFLPNNNFDIRITIIGNRAFAFRRFNRPNDFRASGSGRIDWDPEQIPDDALQLAFKTARTLQSQSLAVDVLRRDGQPVIAEISYYYEGWAIESCPGHWIQQSSSDQLTWVPVTKKPEDAIWEDFVAGLT